MDWFLYDRDLRYESVKGLVKKAILRRPILKNLRQAPFPAYILKQNRLNDE